LQEAQVSLARIESAGQEQIIQARARLDSLAEVRPVDVTTAEAEVQSAIATVAEANANLDKTYVRAPLNGQVLKIHTRSGETIDSEGIATLGQTAQMFVVADVYQDDITKIEPGQPVTVTTPVLDIELQGTVQRIGLQVEAQEVINEDPAANIDAKVIEVHIQLDEAARKTVAGLTNLQVTATIQID
ncbi:MAG: efflux RND transporter periplasmic adaptor subunit, partial [Cyanobacteria bacterium J06626_26]